MENLTSPLDRLTQMSSAAAGIFVELEDDCRRVEPFRQELAQIEQTVDHLIVAPDLMGSYCCGALPQPKAAIACRQICRSLWITCRWRRGLFAGCHSGGDDAETARVVPLRIEAPYCPTICGRCSSGTMRFSSSTNTQMMTVTRRLSIRISPN